MLAAVMIAAFLYAMVVGLTEPPAREWAPRSDDLARALGVTGTPWDTGTICETAHGTINGVSYNRRCLRSRVTGDCGDPTSRDVETTVFVALRDDEIHVVARRPAASFRASCGSFAG